MIVSELPPRGAVGRVAEGNRTANLVGRDPKALITGRATDLARCDNHSVLERVEHRRAHRAAVLERPARRYRMSPTASEIVWRRPRARSCHHLGVRPLVLVLLLSQSLSLAAAQDVDPAALVTQEQSLRARVAADDAAGRTGTGARCELGFVLVRLGRSTEAVTPLDQEIAALGSPTDAAGGRRLAACLYNRGRAAEDLHDLDGARAAYRRSLALRPNPSVTARLAALPHETPESIAAAAALSLCRANDDGQTCEERRTTLVGVSEGTTWLVVELGGTMDGRMECGWWYGVAVHDEVGAAVEAYGYCFENPEDVEVRGSLHALAGCGSGLVVEYETRWGAFRGAPAGGRAGLVVAWWSRAGLSSFGLGTASFDPPRFEVDVVIDEAGRFTLTRVSGRVPAQASRYLGTHTAQQLRQLSARE